MLVMKFLIASYLSTLEHSMSNITKAKQNICNASSDLKGNLEDFDMF